MSIRPLRAVGSGIMLLGAAIIATSAVTIFRDGSFADWVPNLPSSPLTVVIGAGAIAVGAAIRRRHQLPSTTQPLADETRRQERL